MGSERLSGRSEGRALLAKASIGRHGEVQAYGTIGRVVDDIVVLVYCGEEVGVVLADVLHAA